LTAPNWTPLGSPITGNGALVQFSDSIALSTNRFFRLRILAP